MYFLQHYNIFYCKCLHFSMKHVCTINTICSVFCSYRLPFNCLVKVFLMVFKKGSVSPRHLLDPKYSQIKQQYCEILLTFFKLNFQQSLLQSQVSHDPSEIILIGCFGAKEKCLIIISVGNSCSLILF